MNDSLTKYFLSGGVAGLSTVVVGHPMDTIKVRLQTMPVPNPSETPLYTGTIDCFKKTIKREGFKGLYKGVMVPFTMVVPMFSVAFVGFGLGKKLVHSDVNKPITSSELFAAGAFSGTVTTPITVPAERIKCLLQVQQSKYKSMLDCVRQLYAKAGIRNIYKGTVATLIRDVPGAGMYFLTYDWIKGWLPRNVSFEVDLLGNIIAGGFAGIANWTISMPADVLKSRLQTTADNTFPNRLRDVFKHLMAKEGPTALYRGLTPVMLRAFPVNATCFVVFELCMKFLNYIAPNI